MKAALVLAIASLAAAQNLSGEPACATSCLSSAISRAGCDLNDQACQCGPTQAAIGSFAAPCLIGACAASDLGVAASVGSRLCAEYSSGLASATTTTSSSGTGTMVITSTSSSSSSSSSSSEASTTTTTTSNGSETTSGSSSSSRDSGSLTTGSTTTGASSVSGNLAAAATPAIVGAVAAVVGVVAAL
ncbi:hypothetical protein NKR19_g10101 [Coniochaeta hoffmannii]|uniref:CFEM domain-containing protein n=1 Tax=Coniochaeta hoffmannii TaxID=91930 RepID=A0AA38R813_9PEZI|nr:hypothetical protein NKR19_g10101 [Coniochaeta hoffmannii]